MTGTASVSKALFLYRLFTVLPLFFFALYDHRHHKVRNAALLAFLPWCLFYVPLSIRQEPLLPDALVILTAALGFFCGGMLLLLISMVTNESIGGGDIKLVRCWASATGHRAFWKSLWLPPCLPSCT